MMEHNSGREELVVLRWMVDSVTGPGDLNLIIFVNRTPLVSL
jgi:hypothetical protein